MFRPLEHDTNIENMDSVKYKRYMENNGKRRLKTPLQLEGLERCYAENTYPSEAVKAKLAVELMLSKDQVDKWFCHRRQKEKRLNKDNAGSRSKLYINGDSKKKGSKNVKHLRLSSLREGQYQWLLNIRDSRNAIENTCVRISSSQEKSTLQNGSPCELESARPELQSHNDIPMMLDRALQNRQNPYGRDSKRRKIRALKLGMKQKHLQEAGRAVRTSLCRQFCDDGPLISTKFDPLPPGAFNIPIDPSIEDTQIYNNLARMLKKRNVQEIDKMGRSCHVSDPHSMQLDTNSVSEALNSELWRKNCSSGRCGGMGKAFLPPRSGGMGKALLPPRSGGMEKASLPPESGGMGKASLPPKSAGMGKALLPPLHSSLPGKGGNINMEVDENDLYRIGTHQETIDANLVMPDAGQSHLLSCQGDDKIQHRDKAKVQASKKHRDRAKCDGVQKGKTKKKYKKSVKLVDDGRLDLGEIQTASDGFSVGAEIGEIGTANGEHTEGLLARFPPGSLRMKKPIMAHPWMDAKENVKNLFMVIQFLYTYGDVINLCSFTLDEFVQAFHDHDSMLLGQIHIALLKLLVEDIENELKSSRTARKSTKHDSPVTDCGFLQLIQSVKRQDFDIEVWHKFLNPLTWPEILRQVALEAGFGPKQRKEEQPQSIIVSKDANQIGPHGLVPGTLKHSLFQILLQEGTSGLKVSEVAKHVKTCDLNDIPSQSGLEALIFSTLTSDITLFERISSSAFRLRANLLVSRDMEHNHSCSESSEVETDYEDSNSEESDTDENGDSAYEEHYIQNTTERAREGENYTGTQAMLSSIKGRNQHGQIEDEKNEGQGDEKHCDEIDESHVGDAWLLGLMEGEYADLSVEERLNALVALVNLVKSGNSIRRTVKDPLGTASSFFLQAESLNSGSKNKRYKTATLKKSSLVHRVTEASGNCKRGRVRKLSDLSDQKSQLKTLQPSCRCRRESVSMQCICLGSDRRYNTYWQFVRTGSLQDPGCGRVYFESSEDGHWEVIDNEETLEAFMELLDTRSIREANLLASLRSCEILLRQEMYKSKAYRSHDISGNGLERYDGEIVSDDSPVTSITENNQNSMVSEPENDSSGISGAISVEFGRTEIEKQHAWDRCRAFDKWVWNGFFQTLNALKYNPHNMLVYCEGCNDLHWPEEVHCNRCHTTFELDFDSEERYAIHVKKCKVNAKNEGVQRHKVISSRLQSLKAGMQAVEAMLPVEAIEVSWKRSGEKVWIKRLRRASSLTELAQVLADFENAIRDDWLCTHSSSLQSRSACREMMHFFLGSPHTLASMALWLVRLDAVISARQGDVCIKDKCKTRLTSKGNHGIILQKC